jgi:hypothetical protein
MRLPKPVQYVLLGLWVRLIHKSDSARPIHAHNTSGYGLAALVSGKKYGITSYGTEIFSAPQRSRTYRTMIKRILARAAWVTTTSPTMEETLIAQFDVPQAKIHTFSLGVPDAFVTQASCHQSKPTDERMWCVNRRIHPHYDTLNLVSGFLSYRENGGSGRLTLLAGDVDPAFMAEVEQRIAGHDAIEVIPGFLNQEEMIALLDRAHFAISVPFSDQLSSAILEGAARGAVPILRDLPCYDAVKVISILVCDMSDSIESYAATFEKTAMMDQASYEEYRRNCMTEIQHHYTSKVVREKLDCLYD